uniref:Deleted in primary ciliary dyskinesia n=1 Tax=Mus musculus TaxID=10090 RepID=A0A494BAZ3_MOUSE
MAVTSWLEVLRSAEKTALLQDGLYQEANSAPHLTDEETETQEGFRPNPGFADNQGRGWCTICSQTGRKWQKNMTRRPVNSL